MRGNCNKGKVGDGEVSSGFTLVQTGLILTKKVV